MYRGMIAIVNLKSLRYYLGFFLILAVAFLTGWAAGQQQTDELRFRDWTEFGKLWQVGYLKGYADAEVLYQTLITDFITPVNSEKNQEYIRRLLSNRPMPKNMTMGQIQEGIEEFCRDWRNRGVKLTEARRIVLLQIAGRPASEIEEATLKARRQAQRE